VSNIKRILIAATLLLSLVGGAGQASATPPTPPTSAGVTVSGFGVTLTAGITWE
jgi:hypothetical protein